eukprot:10861615-Alexandrium_andersonii.AAC.1
MLSNATSSSGAMNSPHDHTCSAGSCSSALQVSSAVHSRIRARTLECARACARGRLRLVCWLGG